MEIYGIEHRKKVAKKYNLVPGAVRYDSIKNDNGSIRIHMRDGKKFIFTYPRNGHYTLATESFKEE